MKLKALLSLSILFVAPLVNAQVFDEDYGRESRDSSIFRAEMALRSDRMFRGQNLYNGTSVEPKLKVGTTLGSGRIYADVFAHFSAEDEDPRNPGGAESSITGEGDVVTEVAPVQKDFTEVDYNIGYELDAGMFILDFGHRWYTYSEDEPRLQDSAELHATLDFDLIAHPYITAAWDYDEYDGFYYETGLRQPIPLGEEREGNMIIPFLKLGFNSGLDDGDHPIYDDTGVTHLNVGVYGHLPVSEFVAVQPEASYNEDIDDATNSEFTFGVNLVGELLW